MRKTQEKVLGVRGLVSGPLLARFAAFRPRRPCASDFYADPRTGIGREKRRSPRHPSSREFGLRWCEEADDFKRVGQLVDVSRTGALGIVPGPIAVGRRAVLSLDGGRLGVLVVEAVVLAVEPGDRVRFAFVRPCSTAFLWAAIGETSGGDGPDPWLGRLVRRFLGR